MDRAVKEQFDLLSSTDDTIRMGALQTILKLTDQKVDWIYEVWDELFTKLKSENSFQRSIGIMVICNLAKSDTQDRLNGCLNLLLAHTRDDKVHHLGTMHSKYLEGGSNRRADPRQDSRPSGKAISRVHERKTLQLDPRRYHSFHQEHL
jgi:hypothetical protein